MAELTVPPSPSWYLSSILACSDDGKTLAYGARHEIVLLKTTEKEDGDCDISSSFIPMAHKDRVTAVAFPPSSAEAYVDNVVSSSDDGTVRVWNYNTQSLRFSHSGHPEGHKLPSLDWSRADANLIVSVSDMGSIVCWDLMSNTIRRLYAGTKVLPVCVACSPHNKDVIAIGAKHGLIIVYNIKGNGEQVFRLRGHETDVVSLAFCPKPHNVFKSKSANVHLLVSGSKDRSIYFWKTGTDGRLEYSINLPQAPMHGHRNRNGTLVGSGNSWISVSWPSENLVLTSSLYGELLAYDLKNVAIPARESEDVKKKPKPILVHGVHLKGLFSIAAPQRDDENEIKVWTSALDKHIVCTKYKGLKVLCNITTMGGIVYCMAASPLDPYRIAIGSGDNKINIWNLSSPQSQGMQTYWSKINSKVMALAWHPVKENVIAFGTGEGRVGLLDVSGTKPPTLLRLYHRKCVYSLIWAPPVIAPEGDGFKLALFSVGDGEIAQYNPEIPDREPESLQELLMACDTASATNKTLIRTDLAFNHDKSLAAIGNENGSVYVVSGDKFEYIHTIFAHKKLVQCLAWHPATVTSESCPSQYSSWLASASDNIQIISITKSNLETVRSLGDHCEKVVSLMWSPHINGRLITASYDYTSQVWDVIQGTKVSWLEGHHGAVVCCMFSPIHPDMVITGSADYTVRVWDMNKHSDFSSNICSKNKKQRLKGAKVKFEAAQEATDLNPPDGSEYKNVKNANSEISSSEKKEKVEGEKTSSKRRQPSMFPVTSSSMASAKHINVLWQRIRAKEKISDAKENESDNAGVVEVDKDTSEEVMVNGSSSPTASIEETGYLDFFGDEKCARRLLAVEETHHLANNHFENAMHASLWTGEISDVIYEAKKKKQLNDWLVSLAPLVSYKVWVECCISYAEQLIEKHSSEGQGLKAAGYLLAVHKVEQAVDCLITCKLPREAVVLAKCRLAQDDPMVEKAVRAWISHCLNYGQHILAAHCLLSLGDRIGCVELLSRSKDANTLSLASDIAASTQSKDLAAIVAVRSVTLSLLKQDFEGAEATLLLHPNLKELKLWTKVCAILHNETKIDDSSGLEWLSGNSAAKASSSILIRCLKEAQSLLPLCSQSLAKNIPSTPDFTSENGVWLYVGGQLSLSLINCLEKKVNESIDCIVKALNAAYIYQNYQRLSEKVFLQLAPFIFPQGPCLEGSALAESLLVQCGFSKEAITINDNLGKKLEAHVLTCAIYWLEYLLSRNSLKLTSLSECIKEIFTRSSAVILDKDILTYFTNEVKIKSLEKQVAVVKLEARMTKTVKEESEKISAAGSEDVSKTEDSPNLDQNNLESSLEVLKTWKATFESKRWPTVNPFVVYCCIKDVLQQLVSRFENEVYEPILEDIESKWESLNV